MKVGIIGQGASGLFLALLLKKYKKEIDITIIDKNPFFGRKFVATGSGRCNLLNTSITKYSYNDPFVFNIIKKNGPEIMLKELNELGVMTRSFGTLVYPFCLKAKDLLEYLLNLLKKEKVRLINNENFMDYEVKGNKIKVLTNKKTFVFDKLVIACGNQSAPNLGGTNSVYNILGKHKYSLTSFKPGLCPIQTQEQTKTIENERVKCKVSLMIDKNLAYEEEGEVIFKSNGLSGIAIFNVSSIISRSPKFKKAVISLDLMPDVKEGDLINQLVALNKINDRISFLDGIFTKTMSEHIRKTSGAKNLYKFTASEIKRIAYTIKNLTFTYKEHYTYSDSQVTVGGVNLNEVLKTLESKKEPGVYFVGEVLNADGLCGGYNLLWAFSSSRQVAFDIIKTE